MFSIWFLEYLDPHSVILHVTSACLVTPTHFCSVFSESYILHHANFIFSMVFRIPGFHFIELQISGGVLQYGGRLPFMFLSQQICSLKGFLNTYVQHQRWNFGFITVLCVTLRYLYLYYVFSLCETTFSSYHSCCLSIWQCALKHYSVYQNAVVTVKILF